MMGNPFPQGFAGSNPARSTINFCSRSIYFPNSKDNIL
jgi:hypothetical protein